MRENLMNLTEESSKRENSLDFEIGDLVDVHTRILEGTKERIQIFSGTVIARRGRGTGEMFTVRRIVAGEGVERTFPIHSPKIADLVVKRHGKVRRAKLFYLRDRVGKATRLSDPPRGRKTARTATNDAVVDRYRFSVDTTTLRAVPGRRLNDFTVQPLAAGKRVADADVVSGRAAVGGWLKKLLGNRGERTAARYLRGQGFRILARQFSNRFGEIDLIALDGDTVVFVEVKTRQSAAAGLPAESVTLEKQTRLTRAALAFLKSRKLLEARARFDVVSVMWPAGSRRPQVEHYRDAFPAVGFGQMFS